MIVLTSPERSQEGCSFLRQARGSWAGAPQPSGPDGLDEQRWRECEGREWEQSRWGRGGLGDMMKSVGKRETLHS